jgi:hypothetical protein
LLFGTRAADGERLFHEVGADARREAGLDVFDNAEALEQRQVLVCAGQPEVRDTVGAHRGIGLSRESDRAAVGRVDAADDVDQRTLACAVRADHGAYLAFLNAQVDARQCRDAAKRQRDTG